MGAIFRQQILDGASALLSPFVGLRFSDIWALKAHLQRKGPGKCRVLTRVYAYLTGKKGAFIGVGSRMAQTPVFPHDIYGVFISEKAVIGKGCTIFQQVTIGSNTLRDSGHQGSPVIGDNVFIGAGAKIIGGVTVGDNCRIGAGAVVVRDMPPGTVAVSAPTRFFEKPGMDNTHRSIVEFERESMTESEREEGRSPAARREEGQE